MLDAALAYIAQGFKVFPVKPDKKPLTEHGLKNATQLQIGVKEYWGKWPNAGIGLVTDGFVVMDFDPEHGGLESKTAIEMKYGQLPRTRIHRTGGGGLHYIYRNPNGTNIRNTVDLGGYQGVDLRANGGYIVAPPSLHESGARYAVIDDSEIAPAPVWLMGLTTKKQMIRAETIPEGQPILEGQRNATLTSLAGTMRRPGMSQEAIEAALLEVNRKQCQPPLSEDEVKAIAQSVSRYPPDGIRNNMCMYNTNVTQKSTHERDKNVTESVTVSLQKEAAEVSRFEGLSKRVQAWAEETTGWFETSELDRDLGIMAARDKENRRQILLRLRERGIIEAHQKLNKQFRYVNTKATSLAFKTATNAGILPVKWPLGIERYVNLFPGNMAVVAGSPNAGKTALLLNFIYSNQDAFPIYYLCSEMGPVELRDRLDKFPGMAIEDWHFEAIARDRDFADVIHPDCVNVIDYLEMTTELYLINTYLTAISHKLGSGIAIVALQKKQGATFGRGQEFGMEKPKLYLSMDKGKLTIVKGKSWATKNVDPNGLQMSFKITDGCQLSATGEWDWVK
jgi:hypothetical protein